MIKNIKISNRSKEKGTKLFETITDKISDFILDFSKWTKPLNGKNE